MMLLPSVSLKDYEKLVHGRVADVTPLSSRRSSKGRSTDSSHLHLSAAEMLSLRTSDPLPQKLLAHLAEGERADLCSLSPCMLRLSGAGFAYYAPGPETSVWTWMHTLKLCARESCGQTRHKMCSQNLHLKDQGFPKYKKYKIQTNIINSSPCAFSGIHLTGEPFRYCCPNSSSSFSGNIFVLFRLSLIKVLEVLEEVCRLRPPAFKWDV